MGRQEDLADALASLTIFSDLSTPELLRIVETFTEVSFPEGDRVLRQGLSGAGFYVILEGEATVRVDGVDRATLSRGEFFGEVSILLGEMPVADIVAARPLRCLLLAADQVEAFLNAHPKVMYRMLQVQARRLRQANQWRI
ncbi:MAG TPA: cyclic nucleotide-binding domain-containing protein [Candidatus Solibacter sp.]|nr:cyclic nucleotide-binding domain-containing protein [Candidatus Solibacter sp.]